MLICLARDFSDLHRFKSVLIPVRPRVGNLWPNLLEKAIYELGYELNSRPKWAVIPLKGISNIINH